MYFNYGIVYSSKSRLKMLQVQEFKQSRVLMDVLQLKACFEDTGVCGCCEPLLALALVLFVEIHFKGCRQKNTQHAAWCLSFIPHKYQIENDEKQGQPNCRDTLCTQDLFSHESEKTQALTQLWTLSETQIVLLERRNLCSCICIRSVPFCSLFPILLVWCNQPGINRKLMCMLHTLSGSAQQHHHRGEDEQPSLEQDDGRVRIHHVQPQPAPPGQNRHGPP